MTPQEAKQHRKKLHREIANELRAKDRIMLHQFDAQIRSARAARHVAIVEARALCRRARVELREKQRVRREQLKAELRRQRLDQRTSCQHSVAMTAAERKAEVERLKREKKATRAELRNIERAGKAPRLRSTSHERRQESDDEVRRNIPSELLPVFEAVRSRIKGTTRLSRSEAFLHWAHENPDEIVTIQQADADRFLARLLSEQKQHKRGMRKAGRYRISPEEVERRLADVPF